MTRQERVSIDNALWLCQKCARVIDRDESKFTVDVLRSWKESAEQFSLDRAGKPLERDNSVEVLTQALTGRGKEVVHSSIPNVVKATKAALEIENPGLEIQTEYRNGEVLHKIFAKQGAEIAPILLSTTHAEDAARLQEMLEKGIPFDAQHPFTIESPYPLLNLGDPIISFKPDNIIGGELRIFTTNQPREDLELPVQISWGVKYLIITSSIGDITLQLTCDRENIQTDSSLSVTWNKFSHWEGKDISNLPHFRKMDLFLRILCSSGCDLEISIEGQRAILLSNSSVSESNVESLFEKARLITKFAQNLDLHGKFNSKEFLSMDIEDVLRWNLLWPSLSYTELAEADEEFLARFNTRVIADGKILSPPLTMVSPSRIIDFFGDQVDLPACTILLEASSKDAGMTESGQRLKFSRKKGSYMKITSEKLPSPVMQIQGDDI